jgi:hypothetical protein
MPARFVQCVATDVTRLKLEKRQAKSGNSLEPPYIGYYLFSAPGGRTIQSEWSDPVNRKATQKKKN